ncbi:MAG: hypothetical protein WKF55_10260 [Gemmatimonadaceae bacterium]
MPTLVLVFLLCALSCRNEQYGLNGTSPGRSDFRGHSSVSSIVDSIVISLRVPSTSRIGHPIHFELIARNPTHRALPFNLANPNPAFFIVTDASGTVVWSSVPGEPAIDLMEVNMSLKPGGERKLSGNWTQSTKGGLQSKSGDYFVTGILIGDFTTPEIRIGPLHFRIASPRV